MKTQAAIAYAAGKPLEVVALDPEGRKAGEVRVEIRASAYSAEH
jgi:S-(hydroxymethyl)glutathione dehydrogenase/alcohol dehydrogenase